MWFLIQLFYQVFTFSFSFLFVSLGSYFSNVERKSISPSAIVIGGGFAGIAAAHALRNASFQVISLVKDFNERFLTSNYPV